MHFTFSGIFFLLYVRSFMSTEIASLTPCKQKEADCILGCLGYNASCVLMSLATCEKEPLLSNIEAEISKLTDAISLLNTKLTSATDQRHGHCVELLHSGQPSGVFTLFPKAQNPDYRVEVYCDQTTDGGGWTVVQRRTLNVHSREDFNRGWLDYVNGFGNLVGEFWLGLNHLHILTNNDLMELRIDLEDFDGIKSFAKYSKFFIGDLDTKYQLNIGGYSGDAGDSFLYGEDYANLNKMSFSARDMDNDKSKSHCALGYKSGWWFNSCMRVNLNAPYDEVNPIANEWYGILYTTFKGSNYSLKASTMMIRPAFVSTN